MADDVEPRPEEPGQPVVPAPSPPPAPPGRPFLAAEPRTPPRARFPWLLIAVAVVVLAVIAALALHRARPGAAPPPVVTTAAPTSSPTPLPSAPLQPGFVLPGSGGAVVYLQSATAIQRVDLGTGATTVTTIPEQPATSDLLAGAGWVMTKAVGASSGVLVRDGAAPQLLPVAVQQAARAYPAGADAIWVLPQPAASQARIAQLVDAGGNRVGDTVVRVPSALGIPRTNLGASLLAVTTTGTYAAGTGGVQRLSRGTLLGVGTDRVLTWDCNTKGRCDARLDRPNQPPTYVPSVHTSINGLYAGKVTSLKGLSGALSPDARWVALPLPQPTHSGSSLVLVRLKTGHRVEVPGHFSRSSTDQAAWTPNGRYLLVLTGGQLRAVDTTTGKAVTLGGTPANLQHLTVAGTSTM